jgi:hypothetical protein
MATMKPASGPTRAVGIVAFRVFVVVLAAAALGGWAGPQAIDARDNLLFWVGVACFAAAGFILIFGGVWIAASVRALFGDRFPRR